MEPRTQFLHYTLIIIWSLQKLFLFQNKCSNVVKGYAVTSQTNLNANLGHSEIRDGEMLSKYSNVTRLGQKLCPIYLLLDFKLIS